MADISNIEYGTMIWSAVVEEVCHQIVVMERQHTTCDSDASILNLLSIDAERLHGAADIRSCESIV